MAVRYQGNYAGIGAMLNSPEMQAAMRSIAEKAKTIAEAQAPYYINDADGTHYRDSFEVDSGSHGGIHKDRAYATLANTDTAPEAKDSTALIVEYGNWNNPARHILRNSMIEAAGS